MSTKQDGGPAFPQTVESWWRDSRGDPPVPSGMSMRDWFAGMALQGLYANTTWIEAVAEHSKDVKEQTERTARTAYFMADAMLAERAKEAT